MIDGNSLETDLFNQYRDCSRSLWNKYFLENFKKNQDWDIVDSFNVIKGELFKTMVLNPLLGGRSADFSLGHPSTLLKVMLPENHNTAVKINRNKKDAFGYWDHPIKELTSKATLLFMDFFDWNSYDFLDMNLIMCEIFSNPENPDIVGHKLLVEINYVKIFLDSEK